MLYFHQLTILSRLIDALGTIPIQPPGAEVKPSISKRKKALDQHILLASTLSSAFKARRHEITNATKSSKSSPSMEAPEIDLDLKDEEVPPT